MVALSDKLYCHTRHPLQDLKDSLEPAEQLTLLLAAAMHDIGHPGTHSGFSVLHLQLPMIGSTNNSNHCSLAASCTVTPAACITELRQCRASGRLACPSCHLSCRLTRLLPACVLLPLLLHLSHRLRDIRAGLIQAILGTDLKVSCFQ